MAPTNYCILCYELFSFLRFGHFLRDGRCADGGSFPVPDLVEVIFLAAEQKIQARPRKWLAPVALVLLDAEERSHGYQLMERMEEEFGFEEIQPGSASHSCRSGSIC
jgi:hypothetical protein